MQNTFEPLIPRRHKLHSRQVEQVFLAKFTSMFWRTTTDFILGNLEVNTRGIGNLSQIYYISSPKFSDSATEGLLLLPLALLASNNIVIQLAQCRYRQFHFQPSLSTMRNMFFLEKCVVLMCSCSKNSFSPKNGRQKNTKFHKCPSSIQKNTRS